jgi:hypothetical protein
MWNYIGFGQDLHWEFRKGLYRGFLEMEVKQIFLYRSQNPQRTSSD